MWWKSPYGYSKFATLIHTQKIHWVAIFTILYGNYYRAHREFNLICIGNFVRRTWVNFTKQYGKNRQRCQQNTFYDDVWQLLLFFYREFPSKILSVRDSNLIYLQAMTSPVRPPITWKMNLSKCCLSTNCKFEWTFLQFLVDFGKLYCIFYI